MATPCFTFLKMHTDRNHTCWDKMFVVLSSCFPCTLWVRDFDLLSTSPPPLPELSFNHHYNYSDTITPSILILHFNRTSNRWLVYITVHTTCKMRLYNNRVGDGGQCKHSVDPGSARSGWRLAVDPHGDCALSGSDRLSVTFSMRSRHSALSIQSMASHWIPSL